MSNLEISFEIPPWERALEGLAPGDSITAEHLLTLLEAEDEMAVDEALHTLEEKEITLDIAFLPPPELTGSAALRLKQEAENSTAETVIKGLEDTDPLCVYFRELAATPAAGDPQDYAERYLSGEHHLAEPLVNLCLSRVISTAMKYTGHGVLLLDLIQEGSLGLWQSILKYRGGDFESYSQWWICQYMAKCVFLQARSSDIGQRLRENMRDYVDMDQRLLMELGRNPTVAELGDALGMSLEEAARVEQMVNAARAMAVSEPAEAEQPEEDLAVEDTAYFQLRQRISELLCSLSPEDKQLLTLRFGLEGGKPMSPVEAGNKLGLTPEQVLTREEAALSKLRNL